MATATSDLAVDLARVPAGRRLTEAVSLVVKVLADKVKIEAQSKLPPPRRPVRPEAETEFRLL